MASTANIPPNSPARSFASDGPEPLDVIARVTFYTKSRSLSAKGKKAKTTNAKDVRVKEFSHVFAATKSNYLAFLKTILDKHHLSKYEVSDEAVFPCKVQVPPARYVNIRLLRVLLYAHHILL